MTIALRIALWILGISAILIGVMVYCLGPHWTAGFFGTALENLGSVESYSGDLDGSNVSSEMRFYSVFWFAYGCFLLATTRAKALNVKHVWIIALLFFLGGIGRLIGFAQGDSPDPLFQVLMWIELVVPLGFAALLLGHQKEKPVR